LVTQGDKSYGTK